MQIYGVELAHRSCEINGVGETDSVRHQRNHGDEAENQAGEDDRHLQHVGPGDRFDAPVVVYRTTSTPMTSVVRRSSQPKITVVTMAGA